MTANAASGVSISSPSNNKGETGVQSFPIKLEEARLQNIPEGTNVTAEIDEQGRLMDVHKN